MVLSAFGGSGTASGRAVAYFLVAFGLAAAGMVSAQANPGLAGTWVLDESRSNLARDRAGGPPATALIIEVTDDKVIVDSDTGTNRAIQTFEFVPGGPEHSAPGPLSWDTNVTSEWDSEELVVHIRRTIQVPTGHMDIRMRDVYTVAGDELTIERFQGARSWVTVYERVRR